jgi:hypothetical protein
MRILSLAALVFVVGCGGYENDRIEVDGAKENNPLLIPPCLKREKV